jgi:hypothetical protein
VAHVFDEQRGDINHTTPALRAELPSKIVRGMKSYFELARGIAFPRRRRSPDPEQNA